jgi:hypothetical protein
MNIRKLRTKEEEIAAELMRKLYEIDGNSVGGNCHIVTDDGNIESENIDYCIESAIKNSLDLSIEARKASLEFLFYFKRLNIFQRYRVYLYGG